MNGIVDRHHLSLANKIRNILSVYYANYDLINIGAYKGGTNPELDDAIMRIDKINDFLKQDIQETFSYDQTIASMKEVLK